MNYKKIYDSIISHRKHNPLDKKNGYCELHHIIPVSLGGSNTKNNKILLTAKEHYICHHLLTKMYAKNTNEWHKMINAFMRMHSKSNYQYRYINARTYNYLKVLYGESKSILQQGSKNSQYGSKWYYNIITNEVKKFTKIPSTEWIPGRKPNNRCKICNKDTGNKVRNYCTKHRYLSSKKQALYLKDEEKLLELYNAGYNISDALRHLGYSFSNTKEGVGKWASVIYKSLKN